eukprot:scaffold17259_cov35-Tisochrysis_lutea.AAC.3
MGSLGLAHLDGTHEQIGTTRDQSRPEILDAQATITGEHSGAGYREAHVATLLRSQLAASSDR